jgi:crotonobetainyl-CoA:carnitine CoA-transferase CaiB-like acyl-CoA transferase
MSRVKDRVGEYWVPNAPFQMPGLNTAARSHVPELGENTVDVLVELLGYTREQATACSGEPVPAH